VKRTGASNTGGAHRGHPVLDAAAYRANAGLDHDHDGIACELPRRHGSH